MVKAWKKENIRLNFEKGQFVYRVPLKLWIKAGWKIEKFGISLSDYKELNAEIALNFRTSVMINKDWSLTTSTTSDGYEWLSKPVLKLGPIELPITFIADLIIKSNTKTITAAIDEGVRQNLDIKSLAAGAWKELQQPILLSEEYGLWLRISPKAIFSLPLRGDKGIIRQTSAIEAVTECFTGVKPPVIYNPVLPDLNIVNSLNEQFVANVTSYIRFSYLDSVTRAMLVNTSYDFGKKHITITDVAVYGNENQMIIATCVKGSLNGKLYFSGKPEYRQADSNIFLNGLQFSVQTKNVLVRTASWLANSGIEKILSRNLVYPVGSQIRENFELMQQTLKKYPLGQGFFVTGTLQQLDVEHPVLAPEGIIAPVSIKGKIILELDENTP
jgi:hypothetical protein